MNPLETVSPQIISEFSNIKNFWTLPYLRDVSVEKGNPRGLKKCFGEVANEILQGF
jgi:hypothetical protein